MAYSSSSRVFSGCRALLAAARASTAKSTEAAAAAPAVTKPKKATTTKAKPKADVTTSTTPRANGILKVVPISPALSDFVGAPEVSRTVAVKKIWEHIKTNNLQSPEDKKVIHCDEKLKTIFDGKDKVGFLEIAGLLSRHFVKPEK